MNLSVKEISEITQSEFIGNGEQIVKHIAFDSRSIFSAEDTAFIALNTKKNSGEKYIQSAIEKGIKIIITEIKPIGNKNITWIITENTLTFLQTLAKQYLTQFPQLITLGITGSNGKTMVKEWLYQCLADDYKTVKSPKSFNSQIGLPISLLQIQEKHQIGIFEAGISKPNEMEILTNIFPPKVGILTHIGSAHAANFESELQLIQEKIKLFQTCETIFYNGDNTLVKSEITKLYSSKNLISYGFDVSNDYKIISDWADRSKDILVETPKGAFSFPAKQRDEATLSNALCLIAVMFFFGFSTEKIVEKLNAIKAVEMRLESINAIRNNLIINDSFNLDLDSLVIAFQFIKEYNKPKKVLVLTDFVEGTSPEELYPEVIRLVNAQNFDKVFLIGKEITKIQNKIQTETYTFDNTQQLIENKALNHLEDTLILLKGARKFEIERVKNELELQKHDTVLEINLNAILHNINIHKSFLKPETKMMAMVKAYSYGLGGYEIAEFLQHHHIDYLGVAYVDEGVALRQNGITTPIIVMNPEQHSYNTIIDYNLEPEIYSFRLLEQFYETLKRKGYQGNYPIHIKLETGMHRLGFKTIEIPNLIQKLKLMDLKVSSIFSHLSSSDVEEEKDYTMQQIKVFSENSELLMQGLGYTPIRHILNSAGIVNFADYQFDMVRIGIGMIGISANQEIKKQLQNAVVFKTVISQISEVEKGDSIGYSRKYRAEENTKIATIPVGYADGIPRLIGNKIGNVGIRGQLVPIVGNVCMDTMMIDIKNLPANEGDEIIIFNGKPSLEDFSQYCKTIPYEVLTSISRRVKRVYVKD
ncbi:MAG: bifunctional UDP-N-acetylmuramoyl-tripeptide:D-alanyl-D-alanine ligase/alanine racemase [Cruoricaptor ignavus]|nr:bifunctional UDP-N-acetylmuramoyl-tripeptide:D-alanyl-D-alanine ligase/alanine racemase [Cruoricaptor ignavus]